MITIIDYGMGNLRSAQKAFEFLGFEAEITDNKTAILAAEKIVLPGVGAFADAMSNLNSSGISNVIKKKTADGTPFLGICLGMQLVFDVSYEGGEFEGLGLIKGEIKRFDLPAEYKVPHIGWNKLNTTDNILFSEIDEDIYTYFVHSYHAVTQDKDAVIATSNYGTEFTAAVNKDNIFATQFHPEKSGDKGLKMLRNFAKI
ncbi:MAG: imidazole glycerol phosphate synthase subunit HisH [Clostridia bacterium]|nr:imidazole glycerol phosphate synthase subunit HisH [Clostridia bacterium]